MTVGCLLSKPVETCGLKAQGQGRSWGDWSSQYLPMGTYHPCLSILLGCAHVLLPVSISSIPSHYFRDCALLFVHVWQFGLVDYPVNRWFKMPTMTTKFVESCKKATFLRPHIFRLSRWSVVTSGFLLVPHCLCSQWYPDCWWYNKQESLYPPKLWLHKFSGIPCRFDFFCGGSQKHHGGPCCEPLQPALAI
jgi:hypothetical protein